MIKNSFIEGMKFALGFLFIFGLLGVFVYAAGWHTAGEILGGTFLGTYIFNGTVDFKGDITAGNLISDNITLSPAKTQTIYFDPSMTAQEIQDIIDNVSKYIPYGRSVTFQFKDGTYNMNQTLYFSGFYGGGYIYVYGNLTETNAAILHTTQKVFLDFSSQNTDGIYVNSNDVYFVIYNLKIKIDTSTTWNKAISDVLNSKYSHIKYNYVFGTSPTYGYGIYVGNGGNSQVRDNYVSNLARGVTACYSSGIYSRDNDDIGTMPQYGLYACGDGSIGTYSVQPSGSVSNQGLNSGGEIR